MLWRYSKHLIVVLLLLKILTGIMPLITIWLSQEVVNKVAMIHEEGNLSAFILFFLLQVCAFIMTFFLQQMTHIQERKLDYVFGMKMKEKIINKVQRLPYITFESPSFYNQFQRLEMGQSNLLKMTTDGLNFFRDIITISSVLGFLFTMSGLLVPILIVGITPIFVIQMKFGSRRFFLTRDLTPYQRKEGYISSLLKRREPLKEVKVFELEKHLIEKWREYYKLNERKQLSMLIKQSFWLVLARIFLMLTYTVSALFIISLIVGNKIMVGSFVAILQAIERVQNALNSIAQSLSGFYESSFLIAELRAFLNLEERNRHQQIKEISGIHQLEVRDLTFYYPDAERPAIENIQFTITPGKKTAIIGENGSGKTTLIKCMTGLYDSHKSVIVNGIPLEKINLNAYHQHIAVLFQDYNQYYLTAQENIGFGQVNQLGDLKAIRQAAEQTDIDSYLSLLKNGYHSPLGRLFEQGTDLSGGQWQKVALARAIFRKGDLIILDEPTASLDPQSEVEIIERLFRTATDQAIVYITHRLGAARLADEILVMKKGRIVERGTHEELLHLNGEYSKMFRLQGKWYTKSEKGVAVP